MRYTTIPVVIHILLVTTLIVPNSSPGAELGHAARGARGLFGTDYAPAPSFEKAGYSGPRSSPFRAETRLRYVFLEMTEGKLRLPSGELDLAADLGLNKQASLIESMVRTQLGRYSVRLHYDTYLKKFQEDQSNFQWPEFRVGADIDLFNSNGVRLGGDIDATWDKPKFSYSLPTTGSQTISCGQPVTVGAHFVYNPASSCISASFEARYRRSPREAVDTTILEDAEISGGLRFPRAAVGSSTLRGGWRYSSMRFNTGNRRLEIKWSGVYAEYVFYY
jgi:hypothetical protein